MKLSKLIASFYNLFKNRRTRQILAGLMLGFFLALGNAPVLSQIPPTYSSDPLQLVQEAEQLDREGEWLDAIKNLEQAAELFAQRQDEKRLAITLANIGRIQLRVGYAQDALKTWEKTRQHYDPNQFPHFNRRITVYETRALQALGHDLKACDRMAYVLGISSGVCQEEKLSPVEIDYAIALESEFIQSNPIYGSSWRVFGEVLRVLGKLETSQNVLNHLLNQLPESLDPKIKAIKTASLLGLGNTLRARGNLERDRQSPPQYDYIPWRCEALDNNAALPEKAKLFYNGGHDEKTNQPITGAKEFYQDAIDLTESSFSQIAIQAKLNLLTLILETAQSEELVKARELLAELQGDRNSSTLTLSDLPPSQSKVYTEIKLAKSQNCLSQLDGEKIEWLDIEQQLQTALSDAENLKNDNATSFVLGNIGSFDEYRALWLEKHPDISQFVKQETQLELCQNVTSCRQEAQELTHKALSFAQPTGKPHIAYQWQWQLGRLSAAEGDRENAIEHYEIAAKTLESVRSDLLSINSDVQFNFRDNVEPIYRGLIDLLVQNQDTSDSIQTYLKQAIDTMDTLQLAEIENFMRCNLSANAGESDRQQFIDKTAAIIYPILLKDRLSILVNLPNQNGTQAISYRETIIPQENIERVVQDLRAYLIKSGHTPEVVEKSEQIYQWLFQPIQDILEENTQIKTLVFVLDGSFRNIPIAVLRDPETDRYLLENEKYDIAVLPSFKIFSPAQPQQNLNLFRGGVGIPQTFDDETTFEEIEKLRDELEGIIKHIPAGMQLLDENFTQANIREILQSEQFSGIHWKTHGVFSSDPEETFIVAYQEQIKANDLDKLIRTGSKEKNEPLELLVLSACETAQGDNRAVLGLAGIAARSGARSTLSTLWRADDNANTQLMIQFYYEMSKPGMTKVKALHKAQLALFNPKKYSTATNNTDYEYQAPYIWAPYILVGNWL